MIGERGGRDGRCEAMSCVQSFPKAADCISAEGQLAHTRMLRIPLPCCGAKSSSGERDPGKSCTPGPSKGSQDPPSGSRCFSAPSPACPWPPGPRCWLASHGQLLAAAVERRAGQSRCECPAARTCIADGVLQVVRCLVVQLAGLHTLPMYRVYYLELLQIALHLGDQPLPLRGVLSDGHRCIVRILGYARGTRPHRTASPQHSPCRGIVRTCSTSPPTRPHPPRSF